jgi:hypothetical protein
MFTDIVTAGTKALGGARFSLVSLLPGALLATVVFVAAQSGAYGSGPASLSQLNAEGSPLRNAGVAVLLVFGLFLAGVLLQPFQVALVQYLEGYWDRRPTRMLAALAVEAHRRRMRSADVEKTTAYPHMVTLTLRTGADAARAHALAARRKVRARWLLSRYPTNIDRVMPTMLGNILRNGEDTAGERYGLGALTVYPRMYPSISKPLTDAMARQLDMITLTASLCVSFAFGAVVTLPILMRLDLWSLIPAIAGLLAVLSYRGALRAASDHGVLFATTFDLHRFDMIRAMHYELPRTSGEEIEFNKHLTKFLKSRHRPVGPLAGQRFDHSIYDTPTAAPVPTQSEGGVTGVDSSGDSERPGSATEQRDVPEALPPPADPPR